MTYRILRTKLYLPSIENTVQRGALLDKLDSYSQNKLTILTAPSGYGKSTLTCDWLQNRDLDYIWYSIDEKDDFPAIFWNYFCEGLKKYDEKIAAKATLVLQQSDKIDYCDFTDWLLDEIILLTRKRTRPNKLVIVLDDFHHITKETLLTSLNRFIDYMPQWVHVVITSRSLPNLSVSQRLSKLQLNLISREELAFNIEDTSQFLLQRLSLTLTDDETKTICHQTEGWAAAIQLTGLSIKAGGSVNSSVSAQSGMLSDFLFNEVFNQLDNDVKTTLLSLSLMPRFCVELCDAINRYDQGSQVIDQLLASNLLIVPLDNKGKWYRLHSLFQEWLQLHINKLESVQSQQILNNALEWFEKHQLYDEALEIAVPQQLWELANRLFQKKYSTLSQLHNTSDAEHILKQFPNSVIESYPKLALAKAIFHFAVFEYDQACHFLQFVDSETSKAQQLNGADLSKYCLDSGFNDIKDITSVEATTKFLRSHIERFSGNTHLASTLCKEILADSRLVNSPLTCWCYCGLAADNFLNDEINVAIDHAYKALAAAKQVDDGHCVIASLNWLLSALLANGKPKLAEKITEDNLVWLEQKGMSFLPDIGVIYSQLMSIKRELNKLDEAWSLDHKLQNIDHTRTDPRNNINGQFITRIQLYATSNKLDEAIEQSIELESYIKSNFGEQQHVSGFNISMVQAILQLTKGNLLPIMQFPSAPDKANLWEHQFQNERVFYALTKMLKGQDIITLLDDIAETAGQHGANKRIIESNLLKTQYYNLKGDSLKAELAFSKALELCASCGFISLIIDNSESFKALILDAISKGIASAYATLLIDEIKKKDQYLSSGSISIQDNKPTNRFALIDKLTPREVEVLRLIGTGYSNKQISEHLSLAPSTVKSHLNNLYSKLNVKRRTEALLKSKELGIL